MNNQVKSTILLINNLLYNPEKYSRQSLSEKLKDEELPDSESAITRLIGFISDDMGMSIKMDRSKFTYEIDLEGSNPNYLERYYQYKNLYFRNLLQKTTLEQYVLFGFDTHNENIEFLNPLLSAILENKKVRLTYFPFHKNKISSYTVAPLFLKEYLNRWYLITEELEEKHPVFALDRIKNYEILQATFKRTEAINVTTFKHTVGLNFSTPVEKVNLWISKRFLFIILKRRKRRHQTDLLSPLKSH